MTKDILQKSLSDFDEEFPSVYKTSPNENGIWVENNLSKYNSKIKSFLRNHTVEVLEEILKNRLPTQLTQDLKTHGKGLHETEYDKGWNECRNAFYSHFTNEIQAIKQNNENK
jgi:hypothetical protein